MKEEQLNQVIKILVIIFLVYIIYPPYKTEKFKNKTTVYWFHRPGCPHCENMKNEWNRLTRVVSKKYRLKAINTSIPQNAKLARKYGVQGVPHIIKTKGGSTYDVYDGDRSVMDMKKWIENK